MVRHGQPVWLGFAGTTDARVLRAEAIRGGMVTMYEDGLRKALAGVTTFEEVLRVTRDNDLSGYTELWHGTTLHGRQSLDPKRRLEPIAYYHRGSPVALVMDELQRRSTVVHMAVIGLGTGTMAAFARPGDVITFYEIDPKVRDIATNRFYFGYVPEAISRRSS